MKAKTAISKFTTKGRITIPAQIRNAAKIRQGQAFRFRIHKNGIMLRPVEQKAK
ncbi:AbrB/MazE/SpoVT family DNA-binding domain-containing protein [bacterium]|nr:AbrB/MazE/SpoVT family DNA-binding domain-containing protein [bacterium]